MKHWPTLYGQCTSAASGYEGLMTSSYCYALAPCLPLCPAPNSLAFRDGEGADRCCACPRVGAAPSINFTLQPPKPLGPRLVQAPMQLAYVHPLFVPVPV